MDGPTGELADSSRDTGSNLEWDTSSSDHSSVPFLLFFIFFPSCTVKIVVTRTLLIAADLLAGLALATLLLGLDCIKFLKEEPRVKLKMCYGAGVILSIGSAWLGELGGQLDLVACGKLGARGPSSEGWGEHGVVVWLFLNWPRSSQASWVLWALCGMR